MKLKFIVPTILSVVVFGFALTTSAHELKRINRARNQSMEAARVAARDVAQAMNRRYEDGNTGGGTVFNSYRVKKFAPKQKKNETTAQLYLRVLKSALHKDYPITGDEGGYDFQVISASEEVDSHLPEFLADYPEPDDNIGRGISDLIGALNDALENGLLVLIGSGSGNNTMAEIVAVCDQRNKEFFYIMDSNFGSDD
ncbi:MAG TPA: hypothetical protein VJB34_05290 [Bdellovibrionota bacterium]|nr:hypothetical protein [Bdellovibrionota bacterium]